MAAVPPKVLSWLYGVLSSEYHDVDRTYSDIAQTLTQNPNFSLRTNVYTYENGYSSLLINLIGTLPVTFRGTTYMFPVSIWVPHGYPRESPMAFVAPTKDMAVRAGQYVSGEGRIFHPFLAGWRQDRSNILTLLSVLQDVFAREPPVVSRHEQTIVSVPPPLPPLPPELGRPESRFKPSRLYSGSQSGPPPPPPKPYDTQSQSQPVQVNGAPPLPPLPVKPDNRYQFSPESFQNGFTGVSEPMHQYRPQKESSLRTNLPPNPSDYQSRQSVGLGHQQRPYSPVSPIAPVPHQIRFPPHNARQPSQTQYISQEIAPPLPGGGPQPNAAQNQFNQYSQSQSQPQPYHLNSHSPHNPVRQPRASKPAPPQDLLTSPFDMVLPTQSKDIPAPPVPPNPEKDALLRAISATLTQQVQQIYEDNQAALPALQAQETALNSTLASVNNEISQLRQLESLLSSNEAILHKAMRDADNVMEEAKHRKVPGVDEVLVAPTVVAGQLYDVVADERSLEECRSVLSRALYGGRVGGDVWAKQTRSLAREELMKKALVKKIAKGMGLVEERWD
ncbi:hypothetical protein MMC12_001200 [Toensbergia leucococca]|nr:hypothetical protein [Toensbergia leucococca]